MNFQQRPNCSERKKRKKALVLKRKKEAAERRDWLNEEDKFYNG